MCFARAAAHALITRLALLSATIGDPERLRDWLQPCQLVSSSSRTPLTKEVWQLDVDEDPDDVLAAELRNVLLDPKAAAIVFVYRRDAADALARRLTDALSQPVIPYHSGQSASERLRVRNDFKSGRCRCIVATTALAMGVNLPATHVFVRDTTYFGHGKLRVDELLQIIGRAGRGDRCGLGAVLVRPRDDWDSEKLARSLRDEVLQPLRSSFDFLLTRGQRARGTAATELAAATLVATCLGRAGDEGVSTTALTALLGKTLGAGSLVPSIDTSLRWLGDPLRALAYGDDAGFWHLTVLGLSGVRSMLPLSYVAGMGQLTRDLLSLAPDGKLLQRWSALDHLIVTSLLSDRAPSLRRFSEDLVGQVDAWHEARPHDEKSLLFAEWIQGASNGSRAEELLGSLGVPSGTRGASPTGIARKKCYSAMLAAVILDERSRGASIVDLERRWHIAGFVGTDESWRDTALWLIAGHAGLFEVRAFYHHLKEYCVASAEQVRAAKGAFGRMRRQAYELLERIKYCSPLGPLLCGVRGLRQNNVQLAGPGTIRKLEAAGINTLQAVAKLDVDALVALGVEHRFAKQIRSYVIRRYR